MFASRGFRLASLFACVVMAISMVSVDQAEARRGGSFGSRGTRTFQTAPATPTSPSVTAPVQRSTTPAQTNAAPRANNVGTRQNSFFGGLGGSLMRGLFLGGLLGLLFGGGIGGFAGFLGLIVQVLLIFFVIRLVMGAMGRRSAHAAAGGPAVGGAPYQYARESAAPRAASASGSTARGRPRNPDELRTTQRDLDRFEAMLGEVQDAYGREDYSALRRITTPEMMSYLSEELGVNASKGLKNEVADVKLLQGDVSESWREGNKEYATAAMRYSSIDVTRERDSGRVVSGDPGEASVTTELWTFVRERGGEWKLSAIQEA